MLSTLNTLALIVHVAAGFTALTIGVVPMFARKGGRLHNQTGLVFYYSMSVVALTSLWLVLFKGSALFLLFIAIFSYYSTFTGRREVVRKHRLPTPLDRLMAAGAVLSALGMIGLGAYQLLGGDLHFTSVLYLMFGGALLAQGRYDLKRFWQLNSATKNSWLYHHISRICGAYIAAFTAFLIQNANFSDHPYAPFLNILLWVGPGVVGGYFIGRTIKSYKTKPTSTTLNL